MKSRKDFFHTGLQISRSQIQGVIAGQTPGDIYFVDYRKGSDGNDGLSWDTALRTYSAAIARCTSNNNDYIVIDGDSEIVETSMVTIEKNRVHTIGMNGPPGIMGHGSRITCSASTGATNIATIVNLGVRNTFTGIKVTNSMTVAEGLYGFAEGGEFTRFFNSSFYKSTHLDGTTASEFLNNGDSAMFYDCCFGSTVNIVADNVIRPTMSLTATLSGKKCRDNYLENCLFLSKAGGTEHVQIYGANATDVERMLLAKNCTFLNNALSAATPAHAVGFGAAQTQGTILLQDCGSVDHTVMAQAGVGIYVTGSVPTFATTGVAVAA